MSLLNNGLDPSGITLQQPAFDVAQMRNFLMQAPAAIALLDGPEHVYSFVNPLYQQLSSRSDAELLGKPLRQVFPELKDQGIIELFDGVYHSGQAFTANEFKVQFSDGEKTKTGYYNTIVQPIKNEEGNVATLMVHAYEVTASVLERIKKEESEQRFRSLAQNSPDVITRHDKEFRYLYANPRIAAITGIQADAYVGKTCRELGQPEELCSFFEQQLSFVFTQKIQHQVVHKLAGAEEKTFHSRMVPELDAAGNVQSVLVVSTDITAEKKAEQILAESEYNLRVLTNTLPAIIWITAPDGTCTYLNQHWYEFTGQTPAEAEGFGWLNATHPDDREEAGKIFIAANESQTPFKILYRLQTKEGGYRWCQDLGSPKFGKDGSFEGFVGTVVDVHEEKEAEAALLYRKALLEAQNEAIPDAILIVDTKGQMLSYNQHFITLWRLPQHIVAAKDDTAALSYAMQQVQDPQAFIDKVNYCYDNVDIADHEEILLTDGRIIERYGNAVTGEGGYKYGWIWYFKDVTESKKREEQLRESEEQFRQFSNNIQNLAWIANGEGWIYWYNQRWYQYTGTTLEEMQGWGWEKVHHPDHIDRVMNFVKEAWQKPEPFELTFPLLGADGIYRWFLTRAEPITNEEGKITKWIGTNTDVDEQVAARKKVETSEARFRTLIEEAPVATCLFTGREMKIEIANEKIIAIMGKGPSVLGKPLAEAIPELIGQPFLDQLDKVYTTGQPFENRNARADLVVEGVPTTYYFDYIFKPLKNAEGVIYAVLDMTVDVTDHVLARKELQESEARFRTLAEAIPQMVWVCDGEGKVEFFSQNWYMYTGSNAEESLGHGWSSLVHPDDVSPTLVKWNEAQINRTPVSVEYRLQNAAGGYRWVLSKGNPVLDSNGKIVRWFGACTDINEQKEFEKELAKQVAQRTYELARSNEDLQQFAHVASHDLKEPVRKVRIFSAMVEEELTKTELTKAKNYIKKVQHGADRMLDMIEGVLNYSQAGIAEQLNDAVDLNVIIQNICADFELLLQQRGGSILHNDLPVVKGAQVLLQQLFFNLVNNALKFAKADVPPVISINAAQQTKNGKPYVSIQVADNGIGFNPGLSEKIFQTFVRLHPKDAYEGTGLGLALCKKIAERHGGTITASGREGEGAVFTVTLPIG